MAIISDKNDNAEANDLCESTTDSIDCYIGLNRIFGSYEWMDHDTTQNIGIPSGKINATYWTPTYDPNNGYCVHLQNNASYPSPKWDQQSCSEPAVILCDFPPPTPEPTPMPTKNPTQVTSALPDILKQLLCEITNTNNHTIYSRQYHPR